MKNYENSTRRKKVFILYAFLTSYKALGHLENSWPCCCGAGGGWEGAAQMLVSAALPGCCSLVLLWRAEASGAVMMGMRAARELHEDVSSQVLSSELGGS